VKAVDTHLHADHITGLGVLRDKTHCITVMGEQSKADVVSMRLCDGDQLTVEGLALEVIYTRAIDGFANSLIYRFQLGLRQNVHH
jgi:sulfur dioxygenase